MDITFETIKGNKIFTQKYPIKASKKDIEESIPDDCFIQWFENEYRIGRELPKNCKNKTIKI